MYIVVYNCCGRAGHGFCCGSGLLNQKAIQTGMKLNWFWGLLGFLGILGFIMNEPLYYVFFVFFLFFLEPVMRGKKKEGK